MAFQGSSRALARQGAVAVYELCCTAPAGARPEPEAFAAPSISFVRSGAFGFREGRRPALLTAGFLLLGNPGQGYEIVHEHGGGDTCLSFRYEPAAFGALAAEMRREGSRPFAASILPPLPRAHALRRLLEERLAAPAPGLEELGVELLAVTLAAAGAGAPRPDGPDDRRARGRVRAAAERIEAAAEGLSLADLAAGAGLSTYHFLRLFKREVGVTPYRYLILARIRRAIELLRGTALPVTEIAYEVGFGDLSNFTNAFRREVGCSPRAYRGRRAAT